VALPGSDFPEFNLNMSDREEFLAWFNTDWRARRMRSITATRHPGSRSGLNANP